MKNFKKVLFGGLVSLMMVTGVNAALEYEANDLRTEATLQACLQETNRPNITCTLTEDINSTSTFTVTNKDVTLNLNGHTLSFANGRGIKVGSASANLTIEGNGTIDFGKGYATLNGNLIVNNATVKGEGTQLFLATAADVELNNVTATNNKGTIVSQTSGNVLSLSGVYTSSDNIAQVKGQTKVTLNGTFTTTKESLFLIDNAAAEVTVKGGTYNAAKAVMYIKNVKSITVEDGTFTAETNVINATNATTTGNVTIEKGTFTSKGDTIELKGGKAVLTNGTYTSIEGSAINANNTNLTIKNGTFAGKENTINTNSGVTVIDNGNFTSEGELALNLTYSTNASKINSGHYVAKGKVVYGPASITYGGSFEGDNENNATKTAVDYTVNKAKGYSAVRIGDVVYVGKTNKLNIKVADRTNGSVIKIDDYIVDMLAGHEYKFNDDEIKAHINVKANEGYTVKYEVVYGINNDKYGTVTADGFVMPEEEATLVVSFVKASDVPATTNPSTTNPEGDGQGTTGGKDETTDKNPGTFDGIANIVTVAISSLGAAGYSIKKIIKR